VAGRVSGGSGGGGSGDGEPVVSVPEGAVAAEAGKFAVHDGDEMLWVWPPR
jgi:hypothetical protein